MDRNGREVYRSIIDPLGACGMPLEGGTHSEGHAATRPPPGATTALRGVKRLAIVDREPSATETATRPDVVLGTAYLYIPFPQPNDRHLWLVPLAGLGTLVLVLGGSS